MEHLARDRNGLCFLDIPRVVGEPLGVEVHVRAADASPPASPPQPTRSP
jgi:hypothetical protein